MKITDRRAGKKQTLKNLVVESPGGVVAPFMCDGNLYLYFSGIGKLPNPPGSNFHVLNVTKNRLETVSADIMVDAVHAEIVLTEPSAV